MRRIGVSGMLQHSSVIAMRIFARHERPHPGVRLTLFEAWAAGTIPSGRRTGTLYLASRYRRNARIGSLGLVASSQRSSLVAALMTRTGMALDTPACS